MYRFFVKILGIKYAQKLQAKDALRECCLIAQF